MSKRTLDEEIDKLLRDDSRWLPVRQRKLFLGPLLCGVVVGTIVTNLILWWLK